MKVIETPTSIEIRMQSGEVQCSLCCVWTDHRWSVPTYNGDLVSNEFPDDLWHDGGGTMPVCDECFAKHARGLLTTHDDWYVPRGRSFIGGDGI